MPVTDDGRADGNEFRRRNSPENRSRGHGIAHEHDIIVAGAGLAGKLAAAVLGSSGFRVLCCDPARARANGDRRRDNRVTALLRPAKGVLRKAQVWNTVRDRTLPLTALRVVDSGTGVSGAGSAHDFLSSDIGEECFGWTVLNRALHTVLDNRLEELPDAVVMHGTGVERIVSRKHEVACMLTGGKRAFARLLVAADGRNSSIRSQLGIPVVAAPGVGRALSFNVRHSGNHGGVATEIYGNGESFTLVPLPEVDGGNESSVVWLMDGRSANRLADSRDGEFERRLRMNIPEPLGDVVEVSERMSWPVTAQIALRFGSGRAVLIGEAAHVMTPVGAQGFNSTLADITALADSVAGNRRDSGSRTVVDGYCRARRTDAAVRLAATTALGIAGTSASPLVQGVRRSCLAAIHGNNRIRKDIMVVGMGDRPGACFGGRRHQEPRPT